MQTLNQTTQQGLKSLLFAIVLLTFPMMACGGLNPLNELKQTIPTAAAPILNRTEQILRDAELALDTNSSDWQRIVQDTRDRLIAEGKGEVASKLDQIINHGIAATGAEFRCNADFIGQRIREEIQGVIDRLLGRETHLKPAICQVSPQSIELSDISAPLYATTVQIAGYNFDSNPTTQAQLVGGSGSQDISNVIDRPSPYYMTLNLGSNGVQFTTDSNRIILQWQGQTLSTIAIVQPRVQVCQTRPDTSPKGYGSFIPPHTRGDLDSNGNGPAIDINVSLYPTETSVYAQIYMKAEETSPDWTTSEGQSQPITLYTAPAGWRVKSIVTETHSEYHKVDGNVGVDDEQRGPSGLVNRYKVTGDTEYDEDAGIRTGVVVAFNPIQVELEQIGNCISS